MKIEIQDGNIIITMPISDPPPLSKSGKTFLFASTHGAIKTGFLFQDQPITINVNAYTDNPDFAEIKRSLTYRELRDQVERKLAKKRESEA